MVQEAHGSSVVVVEERSGHSANQGHLDVDCRWLCETCYVVEPCVDAVFGQER